MERKQLEDQILLHYNALCQYAAHRLNGDTGAAKDVVQHAIQELLATHDNLLSDHPTVIVNVLYAAVRANVLDIYRKQKRSIEDLEIGETEDGEVLNVDRSMDTGDTAEKAEIKVDVQRALEVLSPEDRIIAVAFYIEGYSFEEIAASTRRTKRSVKYRIQEVILPVLKEELAAYAN